MLYKTCNLCKKRLRLNQKCSECNNKRNILYDKNKRNLISKKFYDSVAWRKKRNYILNKYNYLDVYALKVLGKIVKADLVHHIIEYNEAPQKGLDDDNLIPLSQQNHNMIHSLYEKNKKETVKLLKSLVEI